MIAKLNILLFFAFLIILSLNYCIKNDKVTPYKEADFFECHNQQSWDSLKIVNQLLGSWILNSTKCPMSGKKSVIENEYKLVFCPKSELVVYQGNNIVEQVKWTISVNNNVYYIHAEPSVDNVYGAIFFCNNKVVFYNSWLDGCDYFYTRVEE